MRSRACCREKRARCSRPRSALFAPVRDPGLVIVDEEHEGSYKSHTHPRYHARDMAVLRGHLAGALVVLGSATPSIESYHSAQRGKYAMVSMPARIRGAPLPVVEVADVRAELLASGQPALLARPLLGALRGALAAGAQGLVLLNRRGYASQLLCRGCGQPVPCDRCSQSLTFHRELGRLVCHLCGASRRLPQRCPECRGDLLELRGAGTERVQAEIEEILPEARALRIDSDLTARQAARAFARFGSGECRILVGTQMIAKGHDFRNVSVVGVLQADALLGLPDFRGAERTFQLLTQVAGRAGRHGGAGRVILQCWNGEHYAIAAARAHDYGAFYEREIRARSAQLLPPKTGLAIVLASARDEDAARDLASRAAEDLRRFRPSVDVLGPAPPFRARIAADHRRQIVVRARQRRSVREALARSAQESRLAAPFGIRGARLSLDIDPVDLL
ncbi:MAG: primosomal protein N' [Acidobacteriota bacterium]